MGLDIFGRTLMMTSCLLYAVHSALSEKRSTLKRKEFELLSMGDVSYEYLQYMFWGKIRKNIKTFGLRKRHLVRSYL